MHKYKVTGLGNLAEVRKHVQCSLATPHNLMVQRFGLVQTGSPGLGLPPNLELDFGSGLAPMLNFGPDPGSGSLRFGSGPKFGTELWHP